jgi:hypothetical protein
MEQDTKQEDEEEDGSKRSSFPNQSSSFTIGLHVWVSMGVFVSALVVYIRTMNRGLSGGDEGAEMLAASCLGEIAHPPG